jgi:hypothetical protein
LQQAGFSSCEVWFQYFNFASMIALKWWIMNFYTKP